MIWIGIGIGVLWMLTVLMTLGICRLGALADERMEREFRCLMQEHEKQSCSQSADSPSQKEAAMNEQAE